DVITSVNGHPVTTPREMQKATLALPVGQEIDILVVRNGKLFLTKATAEEQPDVLGPGGREAQPTMNFDDLGITVTDLTEDAASKMGLPKEVKAVVVSGVKTNGLAEPSR